MDLRTSLNHELKVSKNIAMLFQNEAFNDVTLVLNNGELKANKVILCATSKFFYEAFHIKSESEAFSTSTVKVNSTKEAMEMVLKYLYTGKMNFDVLNFREYLDLLSLLRAMGIKKIFNKIQKHVLEKIGKMSWEDETERYFSSEKMLMYAAHSEDLKLTNITIAILDYIDRNLGEIANIPEIKYLSQSLLEMLLSKTYMNFDIIDFDFDLLTEHGITFSGGFEEGLQFKMFTNWLSGNPNCSQSFKDEMLKHFDLKEFSCIELTTFVRQSSLFTEKEISDVLDMKAVSFESSNAKLEKQIRQMECKISREETFIQWLKKEHGNGSSWLLKERKRFAADENQRFIKQYFITDKTKWYPYKEPSVATDSEWNLGFC